jgi:hypothetical protein
MRDTSANFDANVACTCRARTAQQGMSPHYYANEIDRIYRYLFEKKNPPPLTTTTTTTTNPAPTF